MVPRNTIFSFVILTLIILTVSCGDKGVPPDNVTTALTISSGNDQVASAGEFLTDSLLVRVTTNQGAPKPDIEILYEQITPQDGDGLTWLGPRITNAEGYARNKYYADTQVGVDSIRVIASGVDDSMVYFVVTVTPAALDTIHKINDNQQGTHGEVLPEPCIVQLFDQYENPIPDFRVRFVAQDNCLVGTDSTASADTAYTRTNSSGQASAGWIMADDNPSGFSVLWAHMLEGDSAVDSVSFGAFVPLISDVEP